MDRQFNKLVIETAHSIHYGRPTAKIAERLLVEAGSEERAYLIFMAAKTLIKLEMSE